MTHDSTLLKEFNNRDVQRLRNIVSKKYDENTQTQIGYTVNKEHTEGDIWEENGRKWTIKNGIKQTISKLDELRKISIIPLTCPKCNKPMSTSETNKKLYFLHNKCLDCVIQYETQLKKEGKFQEYQENIIKNNISGYLNDLESAFFDTFINNQDNTIVTEQGDIEQWVGGNINKEQITKQFKEEIKKIKEKLNI